MITVSCLKSYAWFSHVWVQNLVNPQQESLRGLWGELHQVHHRTMFQRGTMVFFQYIQSRSWLCVFVLIPALFKLCLSHLFHWGQVMNKGTAMPRMLRNAVSWAEPVQSWSRRLSCCANRTGGADVGEQTSFPWGLFEENAVSSGWSEAHSKNI